MFCAMIGLVKVWPDKKSLLPLLLIAVGIRVATVIRFPAGDDIHRYIWEGKIQLHGYNPFMYAPDSPALKHLRDDTWKGINHKNVTTIYWPFAQLLFKYAAKISQTPNFFKAVFVLFDIGVLLVLLLLCNNLKIPSKYALLYALNPLPIVFTAGDGHLEAVMVFWVILGVYFMRKKRDVLMFLSFGMALMTKVTPVLFLPFVIRRNNLRALAALIIPCMLTLPFALDKVSLFKVPLHFAGEFSYNGLVYSLINLLLENHASLAVCLLLMLTGFTIIFFLTPNPIAALYQATGVFLLCAPTFHPWYLLLMTPFLALYRSFAWITLHLTIVPLIFMFTPAASGTWWQNKPLLMNIEYIPFILAGVYCLIKGIRHSPVIYPPPHTISVIIPVLNEEKHIAECINSIQSQAVQSEIIVVDGGSTDTTVSILESLPSVKLLHSSPGRGIQIHEGIQHTCGDVIIVIHADSRLKDNALSRLISGLQSNPEAAGGSFGALYDNRNIQFRFTELLNNLRARFFGISFGDQSQFFRKQALENSFPGLKLMEDIELSFRIKEKGASLFIQKGVLNSTRRWQKKGYFKNVIKVIFLSSLYIFRRKFGLLTGDCGDFYRLYYGKN